MGEVVFLTSNEPKDITVDKFFPPERLEIKQQWNEMQEVCRHLTKNKVHC